MHSLPSDFVLRTIESTKSVIVGEAPVAPALDFVVRTLEGVMAYMLEDFLDLLQLDLPPHYSLVLNGVFLDPVLFDAVIFVTDYIRAVVFGLILVFAFRIYETYLSRRSAR